MEVNTTSDLAALLASLPSVPTAAPAAPVQTVTAIVEPTPVATVTVQPAADPLPWEDPKPVQPAPADTSVADVLALVEGVAASPAIAPTPAPAPTPQPEVADFTEPGKPLLADQPETPRKGLQPFVDPAQLKRDVAFDLVQLDEAIRNHAGLFVHYSVQGASARRQYELTKAQTEIIEAKLYAEIRTACTSDGKKATEAQIDAAVKQDPRWFAAQERLIEARHIHDIANTARDAFDARKDMLIQVSVDRRKEHEGEMRVRSAQEQQSVANAVRAAAVAGARGLATA